MAETIFTIGHGTRTAEELIELLAGAGVTLLVDVRRFPASRRHPRFARNDMERWLPPAEIDYVRRGEELGETTSLNLET